METKDIKTLGDVLSLLVDRVGFADEAHETAAREVIARDGGRISLKAPAKPKDETPAETPQDGA